MKAVILLAAFILGCGTDCKSGLDNGVAVVVVAADGTGRCWSLFGNDVCGVGVLPVPCPVGVVGVTR